MPAPPVEKSAKPMIAGIMYILAGLIGFWQFSTFYAAYQILQSAGGIVDPMAMGMFGMLSGIIAIMWILALLGAIGCILAAIFCFMRKKWPLALIGGILGFVGLHFLFGLIGFILMVMSRKEFAK